MWGSPVLFFSQGIVGLWFAAHDCFTAELNYVRLCRFLRCGSQHAGLDLANDRQ